MEDMSLSKLQASCRCSFAKRCIDKEFSHGNPFFRPVINVRGILSADRWWPDGNALMSLIHELGDPRGEAEDVGAGSSGKTHA